MAGSDQPYVGEIMMLAGSFPPQGFMTCDGQTLPIEEYETLFNLIGTTYGGDGETTFKLPNLNGRVPNHQGSNGLSTYTLGETGGLTEVTLTQSQVPSHTHSVIADANPGTVGSPSGAYYAAAAPAKLYSSSGAPLARTMVAGMLPNAGGSQPHDNMQPYQAVNYCISLFGVYPSQS